MKHHVLLQKADLPDHLQSLVGTAKRLYQERLAYFAQTHKPPAYICAAPGRVNLIGEHTDYQDGFVLPLALQEYNTVVYGTGFLHTSPSTADTSVRLRLVSDQGPGTVEERRFSAGSVVPPDENEPVTWVNYVMGVIVQFLPDIPPQGCVLDLTMAYASSVPLGAGLSSSASLEVATAVFVECFLHDGMAYSSVHHFNGKELDLPDPVTRALRCQKAENTWAYSPCGIMDQFVVSCAEPNSLLLLDCRSLETKPVLMKQDTDEQPVLLVTNSGVEHSIADSAYGQRRKECSDAVAALQSVPLYHVESLRDATLQDVVLGQEKKKLDPVLYQRAHHVVSENTRTKECCAAVKLGLWDKVGKLMNASHASLKDDFQVSCDELDCLVEVAQAQDGVFGSRMTGGGFGGCTVTLVRQDAVEAVTEAIKAGYQERFGKECQCCVVQPGPGARVLAIGKYDAFTCSVPWKWRSIQFSPFCLDDMILLHL
jgi:galactokinase